MHTKYEKEGVAKAEELEMAKLKMQARLSEAESTAMQLQAKLAQIEKARAKLQSDLEAQAQQLDGEESKAIRQDCWRMEAEGGLLRNGPRQRPKGNSQCLLRPFQS